MEDGTLYLTPTKTAQPSIYEPLAEYQKIVLDAINIRRMGMGKKPGAEIQKAIQQFAVKYGLSMRNIQNDRVVMALALTVADNPMAVNMSFQREYAEQYDWMKQQFIDWAFTYVNSFLYYEDADWQRKSD